MKNSIEEFYSKEADSGYYEKLEAELHKHNKELHAFNNIKVIKSGGYPFSAKDNICVENVETTASSKMLEGYVPPFNATVIERLFKEKFTFIGKTNMDEFGFGTFGINCAVPAKNPFDTARVAGGSSSGAAIATSIMKYHVAIAESTGGSISAPASFCGVVGFTPTYGILSRYGLIDYANSLDKIGVIARSIGDVRYVFDRIKGADPKDSTSINPKLNEKKKDTIFIVDELIDAVDPRIKKDFDSLLKKLEGMGYRCERISIPEIDKAIQAYYIISMSEASTNLAKYTGFKYGYKNNDLNMGYNEFFTKARANFGTEAKRRIALGTFMRGASVKNRYYNKALKVRALLMDKLGKFLEKGYMITPTMPILPPKFDEVQGMDPVKVYSMDILTIPPNLCGFPHISFPFSYVNDLPVGAQIVGNHFDDYNLMQVVESWEREFSYKFKYNIGSL